MSYKEITSSSKNKVEKVHSALKGKGFDKGSVDFSKLTFVRRESEVSGRPRNDAHVLPDEIVDNLPKLSEKAQKPFIDFYERSPEIQEYLGSLIAHPDGQKWLSSFFKNNQERLERFANKLESNPDLLACTKSILEHSKTAEYFKKSLPLQMRDINTGDNPSEDVFSWREIQGNKTIDHYYDQYFQDYPCLGFPSFFDEYFNRTRCTDINATYTKCVTYQGRDCDVGKGIGAVAVIAGPIMAGIIGCSLWKCYKARKLYRANSSDKLESSE